MLKASLQAISASNTLKGNVKLLSSNISIAVDTSLPYLYLPRAVCSNFERAFGLVMNPSLDLYQLNRTSHSKLRTANPSLNFLFGTGISDSVNITVPYQAFDLQTTAPITGNGTNYFPLRCTDNPSQFALGRAFFQESYVIADYEKNELSISQADFSGKKTNIVSIGSSSSAPTADTTTESSSSRTGLSKGVVVGIAVGASVAAITLFWLLFFLYRRRRNRKATQRPSHISAPLPYYKNRGSWPSSPTSSRPGKTPTIMERPAMSISPSSPSPVDRLEERLRRLERANTSNSNLYSSELPDTNSWSWERRLPPAYENRPTQELPGSDTAAEMDIKSHRVSAANGGRSSTNREAGPYFSFRHIAELAEHGRSRQGSRGTR